LGDEIATGSTQAILSAPLAMTPLAITEGLKLTIFTYKWGEYVKYVGKYLPESLI
jgi:hypothetical protein